MRQVLPNGHLVIAGEKQIGVNENVDVLRFSGQVDPRAIQPGNTVQSAQIANVRLEQRGRGQQAEAQAMGWLGALLPERVAVLSAMSTNRMSLLRRLAGPARRPRRRCAGVARLAAGARGAHQGSGQRAGRAQQPAGRATAWSSGLDGTGDQTTQTPFTAQSLTAMLQQMGVTVPAGTSMQLKNVAAVMVTAELPPFAQPGQTHRRQRLVAGQRQEPARRHADRHAAEGRRRPDLRDGAGQPDRRRRRRAAGGSKVQINHLSAGRMPEGASVERAVPTPLGQGE